MGFEAPKAVIPQFKNRHSNISFQNDSTKIVIRSLHTEDTFQLISLHLLMAEKKNTYIFEMYFQLLMSVFLHLSISFVVMLILDTYCEV